MEILGVFLIGALVVLMLKIRFWREETYHQWKMEEIEAAKKSDPDSKAKDINITKVSI